MAIVIMFSFIMPVTMMCKDLVLEKERKLKVGTAFRARLLVLNLLMNESCDLRLKVTYVSQRAGLQRIELLWLSSTLVIIISEVTERIPFTLSRNIRSGCNIIMHRSC